MSQLWIYFTHSSAIQKKTTLRQLLERLPSAMHERALRYRREEDAYNFVLGRLLLKKGLADLNLPGSIDHIQVSENGKPYLESVFFNLSHTTDRVVCAISQTGEVGIDIEKEQEVQLENFESWFTAKEWKTIQGAEFPIQQFYQYWTRKESIIKALGWKLSELNQVELDLEQKTFAAQEKQWCLSPLPLETGYIGAICSETPIDPPLRMKYLDF